MKYHTSILLKLILLLAFLTTGCSVSVANPNTNTPIITSTPISETSIVSASSPTEGVIAFVNWLEKPNIYVMNLDSSGMMNLTENLPYNVDPAWSPDGKYIAFTSSQGIDQIYKMKADGTELKQLTFDKAHSYKPSWSADGKYLIFLSERDGVLSDRGVPIPQAYIMKPDGSEQQRLTYSQEFINGVSWYPEEDFVSVTVANTRYTRRTYLMNLDGVIQKQLPELIVSGTPVWSPNGEFLVFSQPSQNDCSGIIVMKVDNSLRVCLIIDGISSPVQNSAPSWSPSGNYIIFSSNLDGDWDIYMINADGSGLTQLTNMPGDEKWAVWTDEP